MSWPGIVRFAARVALALTLALGALAALPGFVQANGGPVKIPLSYFPNISNWGPTDATGTAVVGLEEGLVEVEVKGLPSLAAGLYQVWVVEAKTGTMYEAGKFNADGTGYGHFQAKLSEKDLPYWDYQLVLLTVEENPDPSPNPNERRSLVGFFARYRPPAPTPLPTPAPTVPPTPPRPVFTWGTATPPSTLVGAQVTTSTPEATPSIPAPTPTAMASAPGTPLATATPGVQACPPSPTPTATLATPAHLPKTGVAKVALPFKILSGALALVAVIERYLSRLG